MTNVFEDFIKVIKKDSRVQNNINIMVNRYMSLHYDFQPRIGYNSLIQNVILKELNNIMARIINDLDIELKILSNKTSKFPIIHKMDVLEVIHTNYNHGLASSFYQYNPSI